MNPMTEAIEATLNCVGLEISRATSMYRQYASPHEAYAVIFEELDEFWEEVKKHSEMQSPLTMRSELIQVAATAVRAVIDLNL